MPTYHALPFPWCNLPPREAPVEPRDLVDVALPLLVGTSAMLGALARSPLDEWSHEESATALALLTAQIEIAADLVRRCHWAAPTRDAPNDTQEHSHG